MAHEIPLDIYRLYKDNALPPSLVSNSRVADIDKYECCEIDKDNLFNHEEVKEGNMVFDYMSCKTPLRKINIVIDEMKNIYQEYVKHEDRQGIKFTGDIVFKKEPTLAPERSSRIVQYSRITGKMQERLFDNKEWIYDFVILLPMLFHKLNGIHNTHFFLVPVIISSFRSLYILSILYSLRKEEYVKDILLKLLSYCDALEPSSTKSMQMLIYNISQDFHESSWKEHKETIVFVRNYMYYEMKAFFGLVIRISFYHIDDFSDFFYKNMNSDIFGLKDRETLGAVKEVMERIENFGIPRGIDFSKECIDVEVYEMIIKNIYVLSIFIIKLEIETANVFLLINNTFEEYKECHSPYDRTIVYLCLFLQIFSWPLLRENIKQSVLRFTHSMWRQKRSNVQEKQDESTTAQDTDTCAIFEEFQGATNRILNIVVQTLLNKGHGSREERIEEMIYRRFEKILKVFHLDVDSRIAVGNFRQYIVSILDHLQSDICNDEILFTYFSSSPVYKLDVKTFELIFHNKGFMGAERTFRYFHIAVKGIQDLLFSTDSFILEQIDLANIIHMMKVLVKSANEPRLLFKFIDKGTLANLSAFHLENISITGRLDSIRASLVLIYVLNIYYATEKLISDKSLSSSSLEQLRNLICHLSTLVPVKIPVQYIFLKLQEFKISSFDEVYKESKSLIWSLFPELFSEQFITLSFELNPWTLHYNCSSPKSDNGHIINELLKYEILPVESLISHTYNLLSPKMAIFLISEEGLEYLYIYERLLYKIFLYYPHYFSIAFIEVVHHCIIESKNVKRTGMTLEERYSLPHLTTCHSFVEKNSNSIMFMCLDHMVKIFEQKVSFDTIEGLVLMHSTPGRSIFFSMYNFVSTHISREQTQREEDEILFLSHVFKLLSIITLKFHISKLGNDDRHNIYNTMFSKLSDPTELSLFKSGSEQSVYSYKQFAKEAGSVFAVNISIFSHVFRNAYLFIHEKFISHPSRIQLLLLSNTLFCKDRFVIPDVCERYIKNFFIIPHIVFNVPSVHIILHNLISSIESLLNPFSTVNSNFKLSFHLTFMTFLFLKYPIPKTIEVGKRLVSLVPSFIRKLSSDDNEGSNDPNTDTVLSLLDVFQKQYK